MAMTGAEVLVKLKAQGADQVSSEVRKADKSTESFGKRVNSLGRSLTGQGALAVASFAGLTGPLVGFAAVGINAASDLNESLSKTQVVFGKAAGGVVDWSKNSATALGLSKQAALEATSTFGNLLSGMGLTAPAAAKMSQEMVQLAADLASFNNVPIEDALLAIKSGLVGESEPMRQFGVLLSETAVQAKAMELGLVDANGEISEQNKVLARQAIIMDQTKNAQGDFARTSEGLANQQRILKAQLGNVSAQLGSVMLPLAVKLAGSLNKLVAMFLKLPDSVKTFVVILGGLLAAAGPVLIVIGQIASALSALGGGAGIAAGAIAILTSPITLVVAALVGLGVAYKTNFLGFGDAVDSVAKKVVQGVQPVLAFFSRMIDGFRDMRRLGFDPFTSALTGVARALSGIGGENTPPFIARIAKALYSAQRPVRLFVEALSKIGQGGDRMHKILKQLPAPLAALVNLFARISQAVTVFKRAWSEAGALAAFKTIPRSLELIGRSFANLFISLTGFDRAGAALKTVFASVADVISSTIDLVDNLVHGRWSQAWSSFKDLASNALDLFINYVKFQIALVRDIFDAIPWGAIGNGIQKGLGVLKNVFTDVATEAWDWLLGQVRSINWGALVGGIISGAGDIASAIADRLGGYFSGLWGALMSVDWGSYIPDLSWADFVKAVDLAKKVAKLAWGVFVTGAIKLTDYVADLDWGTWVSGAVDVTKFIAKLAWSAFISGSVKVGEYIASLDWGGFVSGSVDVSKYIAKLAWSSFISGSVKVGEYIASLDWGGFISGTVDVSKFIAKLSWSSFVSGSIKLTDFIASLDWGSYISGAVDVSKFIGRLYWSVYVKSPIKLVDYIADLDWGAFVSGAVDVTTYIAKLSWGAFVTGTVAITDFVTSLNWGDYITGSVSFVGKVTKLAWSSFVPKLSWPKIDLWPGWGTYIPTIDWKALTFIDNWPGWGTYIPTIDWKALTFIDNWPGWGTYVPNVGWPDLSWPGWGTFVPTITWPTIPEFPGWRDILNPGGVFTFSGPDATGDSGGATNMKHVPKVGVGRRAATQDETSSVVPTVDTTALTKAVAEVSRLMASLVRSVTVGATAAGTAFSLMIRPGLIAGQAFVRTTLNAIQVAAGQWVAQMRAFGTAGGNAFRDGSRPGFDGARTAFVNAANGIRASATPLPGFLGGVATSAANSFRTAIQNGMNGAVGAARNGVSAIRSAVSGIGSFYGSGYGVGSSLGQGIRDGLSSWASAIAASAANAVRGAVNAARAEAEAASPSKKMLRLGSDMGEGAFIGLGRWAAPLKRQSETMIGDAVKVGSGRWSLAMDAIRPRRMPVDEGMRYYQPLPLPPSRGGDSRASGNVYVIMTRSELLDLFDTVDAVKVLTDPVEIAATFGR